MSTFTLRVLEIVRNIPQGKTLSYKEVAKLAGNPGAYRAVGSVMKRNQDMSVPCHRVVQSNGKPGQYNGLRGASKETLLARERYSESVKNLE